MLDDNKYNILEQLTIENKSLWRIKNSYEKDPEKIMKPKALGNVEKDKEELVRLLTEKLRERI